jgi:uncharacterized glyoxalase superfamily protein PhnB
MTVEQTTRTNVKQAVPFFSVDDMEASLRFYVEGMDFQMTKKWVVEGKIRWCWLEIGDAAIMLQEYLTEGHHAWQPQGKVGEGVVISFQCEDAIAIYRDALSRGLDASKPFVGNAMWVTSLQDPDGYRLEFESPTDTPEGEEYAEPTE